MKRISIIILVLFLNACASGGPRKLLKGRCVSGGVDCGYSMEVNNKVADEELPKKTDAKAPKGRVISIWQDGKYHDYFRYTK